MIDYFLIGFTAVVVFSVLFILFTRSILYAAFGLLGTFLGVAAIFIIFRAEFLGVLQILIYVGGVLVLLMFGIMLTRKYHDQIEKTGNHNVLTGIVVFLLVFSGLCLLNLQILESYDVPAERSISAAGVKDIGISLMTRNVLPFEFIAFLLLAALLGAAVLSGAKKKTS